MDRVSKNYKQVVYCRNDDEIFDEDGPPARYTEYKDDDSEEYSTVERTHTTTTEKITKGRKSRSQLGKMDLGAAASFGKEENGVKVSTMSY